FYSHTTTIQLTTLSLHDALPIWHPPHPRDHDCAVVPFRFIAYVITNLLYYSGDEVVVGFSVKLKLERVSLQHEKAPVPWDLTGRSEEHTSELQSRENLVCRLLLE